MSPPQGHLQLASRLPHACHALQSCSLSIPSDMQQHPLLVLPLLWLHQERKTPRAVQQVAQRQRCLMMPAQTPGQGPRSPGAFTPCPPSRTPTPCNTQPVCPAGEAEDALSWHRVIGDRTAQGSSNRDSMSEETLASPCPIHTFAERAAPYWAAGPGQPLRC